MKIEQNFYVSLRHVNGKMEITNKSLLGYLEDLGGRHSNLVGNGLKQINETKRTWMILYWKLKIIKRPKYDDVITVRTWSASNHKLYADRDFEVLNENKEIIAIATSRWVMVDVENKKIAKMTDELIKIYEPELEDRTFPGFEYSKIEEPENFISSSNYTINRQMIDINDHVHNISYYDLAEIAIPDEVLEEKEFDEVDIMYKREIKLNDNVKLNYSEIENGEKIVTIKSEDESIIHAIVKLR